MSEISKAELRKDQELSVKVYFLAKRFPGLNHQERELLRTASERICKLAATVERLQNEIAVQELYDAETRELAQRPREEAAGA